MKKYILTITICMMVSGLSAQLFSPLGNGLFKESYQTAADGHGNLAAVMNNRQNDSLNYYMYNKKLNQWRIVNSYPLYGSMWVYWGLNSCVLLNDTIYAVIRQSSQQLVVRVTDKTIKIIASVNTSNFLKIYPLSGRIWLSGKFDSILLDTKQYYIKNQAVFDGLNWKSTPFTDLVSDARSVMKVNGDTAGYLFPVGTNIYLKRFNINGFSDSILLNKGAGQGGYCLNIINRRFAFTRALTDTVTFISGNQLSHVKTGQNFLYRVEFASVGQKTVFTQWDGFLYTWNLKTNTIARVYRFQSSKDSTSMSLLASDTDLFINSPWYLVYKEKNFGNIAKINFDSAREYGYDTIIILLYHDKNNDLKYNGADVLIDLNKSFVYNVTFNENANSSKGAVIPDYRTSDFVSSQFIFTDSACLNLSFTGYQTSNNLRPGVTRDTLWFPYHPSLNPSYKYNMALYATSTPRHRLRNYSLVRFSTTNVVCAGGLNQTELKILVPVKCKVLKSTPAYTKKNGDTLIYVFNPYFYGYDNFQLEVSYDTSYYSAGDTVVYKAWIKPQNGEDSLDNYCRFKVLLVYSYDPNQKYSIPEGKVTPNLKKIQYHIDFENEGNDYAQRVIIKDTLDLRLPIYEFQMIKSSHPYTVAIKENVVTWTFEDIYLVPKKQDSLKSKGYVSFVARIRDNIREGDSILNKASIYFDYNKPIVTNLAKIYAQEKIVNKAAVIVGDIETWSIYPNPAEDVLTIGKLQGKRTFEIFNMQGRSVWKHQAESTEDIQIPVGTWSRGVYMLVDSEGMARKFILR